MDNTHIPGMTKEDDDWLLAELRRIARAHAPAQGAVAAGALSRVRSPGRRHASPTGLLVKAAVAAQLFDHFVGAGKHGRRDGEPERFRGPEVYR